MMRRWKTESSCGPVNLMVTTLQPEIAPLHVLVADDDAANRTVLNQALSRAGYEVRATGTVAGLWRWVAAGEGDVQRGL